MYIVSPFFIISFPSPLPPVGTCLVLWMFLKEIAICSLDTFLYNRSDYFRNFVDSCLQKIPQDRPTSEELLKVSSIILCFLPLRNYLRMCFIFL